MRTGLVHDYTRRGGVVSTKIMLPDGTSAERNALWNAAESAEKRKDGMLDVHQVRQRSPRLSQK
ncbi:MobA/MobL family protein [Pseudomonas savastanoi]|uniref:MobA/MobL family protein n=1 Tax=Pseudomonas savastanoi TaxID=29438 RepID=UPI000F3D8C04|nr:MobA/MobL family protein [Pseudomonas savastanoi]RMR71725.1 TraA [Pseudomonas savastanoi pv. fraxini]